MTERSHNLCLVGGGKNTKPRDLVNMAKTKILAVPLN